MLLSSPILIGRPSARGYVHIYNHENPLDVLVIQGYLRIPSITTASSHLGKILPFFDRCASNAGHILLDHMDSESRRSSVLKSFDVMSTYGQMIIAPNGSLVTSIYQRASRSPQVLARKFSTRIAPWVFRYGDIGLSRSDLYSVCDFGEALDGSSFRDNVLALGGRFEYQSVCQRIHLSLRL